MARPSSRHRWLKGCGLALVLLEGAARAAAHEPVLLNPRWATPGLRLVLEAVGAPGSSADAPGYRLVATGLPSGIVFNVWTKRFGHAFQEEATGFRAEASGRLVSIQRAGADGSQYLDEIVIQPEDDYPRGAIWEVALASDDLSVTAFAKVIPRPIVARDGRCTITLELVSHRGERFLASGTGFDPSGVVVVESAFAGRVSMRRRRVSDAGVLAPEVLSHTAPVTDRRARFSAKGRSCEVALDYEWGELALRSR